MPSPDTMNEPTTDQPAKKPGLLASARFWSTDGSAQWLLPWTWFSALRAARIGGATSP